MSTVFTLRGTPHISAEGELCLPVTNIPMARRWVLELDKKRAYCCECKEYRQRRSLDANAYFWVLADKLAAATGVAKTEIYKNAIRDIGGNCDVVCVPVKAVPKLRAAWEKNGLGWFCETFESKLPKCANVTLYYGSSMYDSAQMARLIDNIVQDCKAVGIETATPEELARLKEEWDE